MLILIVIAGMFSHTEINQVRDPMTAAGRTIFGPVGFFAILFAGLLATLSSANASILAASRINLAMARDRMVPGFFARIHQKFLTPHRAIVVTGILALLFITLENLELLAKIASVLQLYSYAALNIGCVILRAAAPDWYKPAYRVPGYPFIPLIAAVACLGIIYYSGFLPIMAIVGLILLSLAWYFWVARKNVDIDHGVPFFMERWKSLGMASIFMASRETFAEDREEAPVPLVARRIEPYSPRRVVTALANPEHEVALLRLATWIASGDEEPGDVYGLHVTKVPIQTTLEAAQTQMENQKSVRRIRQRIDTMNKEAAEDPMVTDVQPLFTVAHDPFAVLLSESQEVQGDMFLMGWEGGFNVGRIYESPVHVLINEAQSDMGILKSRGDLTMIHDILLPWGGGLHARLGLEVAARIARSTGARIHVLRVVRSDVDVEEEEKRVVTNVMEIVREVVEKGDVEVIYHVQRADRVTEGIQRQLDSMSYELVIIGASREWKLRNVLFGAIPDVIADQAPCSVLMVRRHVPDHWSFKATEGIKRFREGAGLTTSPEEPR